MLCGLLVKVIAKTAFISETALRLAPRNTLLKTNEILAKQKSRKLLLASVRNHKLKSRKKMHVDTSPRLASPYITEQRGEMWRKQQNHLLAGKTNRAITINKLDMI